MQLFGSLEENTKPQGNILSMTTRCALPAVVIPARGVIIARIPSNNTNGVPSRCVSHVDNIVAVTLANINLNHWLLHSGNCRVR